MCMLYVAVGPCTISLSFKESLAWKMLTTPDLGHMFQSYTLWDHYRCLLKAFFRPLAHLHIVHNVKRCVAFRYLVTMFELSECLKSLFGTTPIESLGHPSIGKIWPCLSLSGPQIHFYVFQDGDWFWQPRPRVAGRSLEQHISVDFLQCHFFQCCETTYKIPPTFNTLGWRQINTFC